MELYERVKYRARKKNRSSIPTEDVIQEAWLHMLTYGKGPTVDQSVSQGFRNYQKYFNHIPIEQRLLDQVVDQHFDKPKTPYDVLRERNIQGILNSAISKISKRSRDIIIMLYYNDMHPRECALAMGCSENWIYQLREKALNELSFVMPLGLF